MIEKALTDIGLSNKEARLYLACLRLGSQTASGIARYAGLNRTTVYDLFDGLIKKGLATKIDKGAAVYFQVLDPKNLISYLEREKTEYARKIEKKKQEIEEILPAIQSIESTATTKPKVQFFEGEKGMREAYEDTLTSAGPIRAYANVEEMHKGLPEFFPEYYQRRHDKNIAVRAISPDNALSKERHKHDREELREMILIPKEQYSFSPELNIYNDKVLIASWREKMAIIIQSEEIADLHRKIYDLVWNKLSDRTGLQK
jgi:sugar-specific transcriptional regulator TrmB